MFLRQRSIQLLQQQANNVSHLSLIDAVTCLLRR